MEKLGKVTLVTILAGLLIFSVITGNGILMPFAITMLLLLVSILISDKKSNGKEDFSGKSAKIVLHVFSFLSAIMALISPLWFGAVAEKFGWTTYFDGDFVRVFINDMQEQAYVFSAVLLLNIVLIKIMKFKNKRA